MKIDDHKINSREVIKRWAKIILFNLLTILLILFSLESYLGYILNHPKQCPSWLFPAVKTYYLHHDRTIIQFDPICAHYDSNLFYKLNSGKFTFSNREFSTEYTVNSMGFRDDEASLRHPKIIVLGDSYTMGWGVDQDQTFTSLIEEKLNTKVLNTGVSSYGTARELTAIRKMNLDSLEYLIIQYCENDYDENIEYIEYDNSLHISSQKTWEDNSRYYQQQSDYFPLKYLRTITQLYNYAEPLNRDNRNSISPEEAFLKTLKSADFIPDQTKIIVFSLGEEKCNNDFISGVNRLLTDRTMLNLLARISYIDLTYDINSTHRFLLDDHLNAKGHQIIAELIINHFQLIEE